MNFKGNFSRCESLISYRIPLLRISGVIFFLRLSIRWISLNLNYAATALTTYTYLLSFLHYPHLLQIQTLFLKKKCRSHVFTSAERFFEWAFSCFNFFVLSYMQCNFYTLVLVDNVGIAEHSHNFTFLIIFFAANQQMSMWARASRLEQCAIER